MPFLDCRLPLGCIVAICLLADCMRIELDPPYISRQERAFGDYRLGRYMWMLDNIKQINPPIAFRGHQGFFDVPAELIDTAIK